MSTSRRKITRAELNRATLARQMLLERSASGVLEMVEHLVGVQAQEATNWYVGLWSRIEGFDPEEVSRLIEDRRLVRIALMRSTLHLVTAEDALQLRPLLQPAVERPLAGRGSRKALRERGFDDILAEGRRLLEQQPLTNLELGRRLAERWPDFSPADLAMAVRVGVPLVQVPPRGQWGKSGAPKHAPLESWVGKAMREGLSAENLVLRYLAAFGPATPSDAQTWSGLSRLREVFEGLRDRLAVFEDDTGRELFDLPDAPRPSADAPAPPRFLPPYDNVLLGHEDRSRFVDEDLRRRLLEEIGGRTYGALLVDGRVAGIWRFDGRGDSAELIVKAFVGPKSTSDQVAEEGARLLSFWTGCGRSRDAVRFERNRGGAG